MVRQIRSLEQLLYRWRGPLLWGGWSSTSLLLLNDVLTRSNPPYAIKDLLVNYADGPVRRGLSGELVRTLSGAFGAASTTVAGCVTFLIVIFIHEAVLFLWPVFAMALLVVADKHQSRRQILVSLALVIGALSLVFVLALAQIPARDVALICRAVQLDACTGPFEFLNHGIAESWAYVYERRTYSEVAVYLTQSLICAVPFIGLRRNALNYVSHIAFLCLPYLAVFPLFFLGYDWGRWIQMAFFLLSLVACAAIITGGVRYKRIMAPAVSLVYVASWSILHAHGSIDFAALYLWPVLGVIVGLNLVQNTYRRKAGQTRP